MVATGDFVRLRIHYDFLKLLKQPSFGLRFFSAERSELARIINYACGLKIYKIDAGKGYIDCVIKSWPFCKGLIFIDLDLVRRGREQLHLIENAIKINVAGGDYYGSGIHFDQAKHHGFFVLPHEWQLPSQ
jgi:hypothetical protein